MNHLSADLPILSQQEVRRIDADAVKQLGIPGLVLMENAARGVADSLKKHFPAAGRILILCGTGNNGGDGLALGRQLAACGIDSQILLITQKNALTSDSAANLEMLLAAGMNVQQHSDATAVNAAIASLAKSDVIVDCLLGTGTRGAVRSPLDVVIAAINRSPAHVLAVDVPSGMNCDDGTAAGACVEADLTVTFVSTKRGFQNPAARKRLGQVVVAHIGLPLAWIQEWLRAQRSGRAS